MPEAPTIRELRAEDLPVVFPIVHQLRVQLDLEQFQHRVMKQKSIGYSLYGAFDAEGTPLGVLGMRPVTTLARGDHLHVDDLVVNGSVRGAGIGRALLQFAESYAADRALKAVFLDSRQEVVSFYSALGYEPHTATLMKKRINVPKPAQEGART